MTDAAKRLKPNPDPAQAVGLLAERWGRHGATVRCLESYDDANFLLTVASPTSADPQEEKFLMKFHNGSLFGAPGLLNGFSIMLTALCARMGGQYHFPDIVPPLVQESQDPQDGPPCDYVEAEEVLLCDGTVARVNVRLFRWIEGVTMSSLETSAALLEEVGSVLGLMTQALQGVDHPSFHRVHTWDLRQFPASLHLLRCVDDEAVGNCIAATHQAFTDVLLPLSDKLPISLIMGDCNDANIIVKQRGEQWRVAGVIDFGDAVMTWTINELAVGMAYMLLTSYGRSAPLQALGAVMKGFVPHRALSQDELTCLPVLLATRLSISILVGAFSINQEPDNEYLKLHALPARRALRSLCERPQWAVELRGFFEACQRAVLSGDAFDAALAISPR